MSFDEKNPNFGKIRAIGDSTQVPNIGRVTWRAEVSDNQITRIEMKSNHLIARIAFNARGSLNTIEIARGLATPVQIAFNEMGQLTATQDGYALDSQSAHDAMSTCYCLINHAAVHRKLAEVMEVGADP